MTNPTSWSGVSAWSRMTQPRAAPVTGAAKPKSGGAADGNRRIPRNQSTKAKAVPIKLK